MIWGQLALIVAAAFGGAALYVNIAEQPARLLLEPRPLLVEWKDSYRRGKYMQAGLALLGGALGIVAYLTTDNWRYVAGTLAMLAPWPWTLIAIKPVNDRLNATGPEAADLRTKALVQLWGVLHGVRSAFGALAAGLFFWALQ